MFNRWVEDGLLDVLEETGMGCIPFSPLEQGLLTDKYLKGIPSGSRASKPTGFLKVEDVTEQRISKARKLNEIATKPQSVTCSDGNRMAAQGSCYNICSGWSQHC